MLDIGWSELVLIAIVALIVVGPKELPGLFKTVGQFMGRARGMAREFQRSMEQAADESGLKEAADDLKSVDRLNYNSATSAARNHAKSVMSPTGKPAPKAASEKTASGPDTQAASTPSAAGSAPTAKPAATDSAETAKPEAEPAQADSTRP